MQSHLAEPSVKDVSTAAHDHMMTHRKNNKVTDWEWSWKDNTLAVTRYFRG